MNATRLSLTVPTKWAICSCCNGNGRVEHPAFSNGFTSSEWAELDFDEREHYLAGRYDVGCVECGGSGKVRIPDVERMTYAQKRVAAAQRREDRLDAIYARESAAERAAEMRMGC